MVPEEKKSPYVLLQELLWPDRWKCHVACMLLNRTKRAQVDQVWPALFEKYPTAESMKDAEVTDLASMLRPLGFYNKRALSLKKMSSDWVEGKEKLHGIGAYGKDSDKIFFEDSVPEEIHDHVLKAYGEWRKGLDWKLNIHDRD